MTHDEAVFGDGLAHDGEIEIPFVEDRARRSLHLRAQHHEHPLLALGQHHLEGAHALLAARHAVEVERHAQAALVAHLHRRAGQPRRAHVLDRDHGARGHQLKARLQQPLFGERVAHLHRGALFLDGVVELGGGHAGAAHPVASGLGAEIDHGAPDAGGRRVKNLVGVGQPGGEGVHEAVAVIAAVKAHRAADRGHAEGVAVAADPGHHPRHQAAGLGMLRPSEAERVHRRDGAGAHGEHVAQDAAHAGSGALIGLDIAGVVVALHLEHHRLFDAVLIGADVHHARVLARSADHLRPFGGQGAQPFLRGFVGAMLVPHRREDPQLGIARRTAQNGEDARVFVRLEAQIGGERLRDGRLWRGIGAAGGHGRRILLGRRTREITRRDRLARRWCQAGSRRCAQPHDV